jgi:hypothetical protein
MLYMYAVFQYPLVMQFFQDQYFSLTSQWLQLLGIGWLAFGRPKSTPSAKPAVAAVAP